MKKASIICASLLLGICLLGSCGKGASTDNQPAQKTTVKKKKDKKVDKDIFFYTSQHRKDKFQPTEPKLGFTDQILSINDNEFKGNENIQEVFVSPKIEHIAPSAFEDCKNLAEVHYSGEMKVLNDNAFRGCSSLKSLDVDVYTVGLSTYEGCSSLESVKFGDHLWWIREKAFAGCTSLKRLLLGITLEKLEDDAFAGCTAMEEYSVPQAMKNRLFGVFNECPNVKIIYILSTEFFTVPKNCTPNPKCTIYVPDAFMKQFQDDAEWAKFAGIKPLSESKYYTAEGFWKK